MYSGSQFGVPPRSGYAGGQQNSSVLGKRSHKQFAATSGGDSGFGFVPNIKPSSKRPHNDHDNNDGNSDSDEETE